MSSLYITLVGGGNSTLCMAPLIAAAGHKVAILTRRPADWGEEITMVNEDKNFIPEEKLTCKPDKITADAAEVIPQSDIIWFCGVPIHHNPELCQKIKPHLRTDKTTFIGSVCTYGGFDWVVRRELGDAKYALFGAQTIPWCCGTTKYGHTGVIYGAKRFVRIATEGGTDPYEIKALLKPIMRQEMTDCDFLTATLWPNNPSIHPPILYGLFKDWDGKTPYDPAKVPTYIYREITQESSDVMERLSDELEAIVKALSERFPHSASLKLNFNLRHCVLENYKDLISDASTLRSTFATNQAYAQHKIPYKTVEGGVVPLIAHKFYETDLPFGLVTMKDVALMVGVATPTLDTLIEWNQGLLGKEFLVGGKLTGRDMPEAITPTGFGLALDDLVPRPAKKQKTDAAVQPEANGVKA